MRQPKADDELVRALYSEYGAALLSYVTGLVGGDRQRAEDIVQETLLRAWRHPDVLDRRGGRSVRAWLFTVARNLAVDSFRARSARPAETFTAASETTGAHDGGLASV
ncbi:MAG: sigma factor, partial [Actinomycetes bacterium]